MRRRRVDLESIVERGTLPGTTRVGRRRVSMSLELGHYLGFDRIGSRLWQVLDEPRSVASLCSQLAEEFGFEIEERTGDVLALVDQLVRDRLVRVVA